MIWDWQDEDENGRLAPAEPLEGAPDQSETIRDVGVILVVVLGAAVLASLLVRLSGG
jgi:hypothetical protein